MVSHANAMLLKWKVLKIENHADAKLRKWETLELLWEGLKMVWDKGWRWAGMEIE